MTGLGARHGAEGEPAIDAALFVGRWSVRRRVVDHLASAMHTFVGTALLTPERFTETGTLNTGDRCLEAERSYGLVFHDDGVDISFADGSPFVRLGFAGPQGVRHACGQDLYVGRVAMRSRDAWFESWRVQGPRKRYSSLSRYERRRAD